ncbi:MAG: hypothetical protein R2699_17070 [Acidimicrobiales bacterium]
MLAVMELRAMVAWAPRDKMPPAMAASLPVTAVSMTLSGPAMMVAMPPPQPVVVLSVMVEPSTVVVPMENRPPPLCSAWLAVTVAFVSETVPTVEPMPPPKMAVLAVAVTSVRVEHASVAGAEGAGELLGPVAGGGDRRDGGGGTGPTATAPP